MHGKTKILHLHHEFIQSIQPRDLKSCIYCLPQVTNYFFTINHPSYAKWLVRYCDKHFFLFLMIIKKGCFGIKRIKKDFLRLPIDLTLEQIVNAEVKRLEFHILTIQCLQNRIELRVVFSESRFFQEFLLSLI